MTAARGTLASDLQDLLRRLGRAALSALFVLPPIAVAAYSFAVTRDPTPNDYSDYGPAGASLVTGNWAAVLDDPIVQAGSFELTPFGIAWVLGTSGVVGWLTFYICFTYLLSVAITFAAAVAWPDLSQRAGLALGVAVAAVAVLGGVSPVGAFIGHPAQVMVPVAWVVAGWLAVRGHPLAAGVAVGLSAGWELWGVLGAPVVLLAPRPQLVRAALGAAASVIVLYLPLMALGGFGMFNFAWPVLDTTIYQFLAPGLETFPWMLRLLQAAAAVAAGCAVALLTRRWPIALWLTPLAILAVRLLLDPTLYGYYWLAPTVIAIGAVASLVAGRNWIAAGAGAVVLAWLVSPYAHSLPAAVALCAVVLAATIVTVRLQRASFSNPGMLEPSKI